MTAAQAESSLRSLLEDLRTLLDNVREESVGDDWDSERRLLLDGQVSRGDLAELQHRLDVAIRSTR